MLPMEQEFPVERIISVWNKPRPGMPVAELIRKTRLAIEPRRSLRGADVVRVLNRFKE